MLMTRPEAAPLHAGQRRLGRVERGSQVDRDDRVPPVLGELLDRRHVLDARVVDEDVDASESGLGLRDQVADLGGLHHVGAVVQRLHAVLLREARAQRLDLRRIAEAVQHHVRALAGEDLRDRHPDAAGGAGDHGVAALQLSAHAGSRIISMCRMPSSS
jgi:hypothetical protein